jgi:exopolysaccharide biosynthesis polyprenyl glycosylphosphotransferase
LEDARAFLHAHVVDEVLVSADKDDLDRMTPLLLDCEREGVRTRIHLNFLPPLTSRVTLTHLNDLPLITISTTPPDGVQLIAKRLADVLLATISLVLLSPLLMVIWGLIRITSRGPGFYRQTRSGFAGRTFTLYKFRSMYEGSDALRPSLDHLNEADGPLFKIANDPRCTPVGRWLRRTSLDELPQLWNILKGDMSFVGPRPPLPEEVLQYKPWQRRRLRMKPGLTCLWVLEGRSNVSFERWMELDMSYIDQWSLLLDAEILVKTVPRVLFGRGAS